MAKKYLEQSIDFLGFLGAKLRDLKGYSALTNELLQNADDAPGVTQVSFDINEMALFVENNGSFREKDFERLRHIAAGQKSLEMHTIGTFGIGFLSVYQITDNPIIVSAGKKWTFYPQASEQQRIIEIDTKDYGKTFFGFPWARNPNSDVRTALKLEHITEKSIQDLSQDLLAFLPKAILFLRKIENIVVKENGKVVMNITKKPVSDNILSLSIDDTTVDWFVVNTHFDKTAGELRRRYENQIGEKKETAVQVAIPRNFYKFQGEFYAFLPTMHQTSLPFHINADFFTSTDRKRVLFENDYQAHWNEAAIQAASYSLMGRLHEVSEFLGPREFWTFLERIHEAYQKSLDGYNVPVLKKVWANLQTTLGSEKIIYTSRQDWVYAKDAFILQDEKEYELLSIFEKLGLNIVHIDLYEKYKLLRNESINVKVLDLFDLVHALNVNGFDKSEDFNKAPEWFQAGFGREKLAQEISVLLERVPAEDREKALKAVQNCHVAISFVNKLAAPKDLWIAGQQDSRVFGDLGMAYVFTSKENPPGILDLIQKFDVYAAIDVLNLGIRDLFDDSGKNNLEEIWINKPDSIVNLIEWLDLKRNIIKNDPVLIDRLRKLPIWPSGGHLHRLGQLFIPGNFDDPLGLSMIIDKSILLIFRDLLSILQVNELTITNYIKEFVPKLFAGKRQISRAKRQELVLLLSRYLGEFIDDEEIKKIYKELPIVECNDEAFRKASEVYFHDKDLFSLFGQGGHFVRQSIEKRKSLVELYKWLGINSIPKPSDIENKLKELTRKVPDHENRKTAQEIFTFLGTMWTQISEPTREAYGFLKVVKWLPVDDDFEHWYSADQVYTRFNTFLFKSQVKFLDVEKQKLLGAFIRFLGIPSKPDCDMVVSHVLYCIENGQEINHMIYKYLNRYYDQDCIERLKNKPFIYIPEKGFFNAHQVFLVRHSFGEFRQQLDSKWYNYLNLLARLDVREEPDYRDAVLVLNEIREKYHSKSGELTPQVIDTLEYCYTYLNTKHPDVLGKVKSKMVVVNGRNRLVSTDAVYFNDRPNITISLNLNFDDRFIPIEPATYKAKRAAGVRLLSETLNSHLLEVKKRELDTDFMNRLHERMDLINRIIHSSSIDSSNPLNMDFLQSVKVFKTEGLRIEFQLFGNGDKIDTTPTQVKAYYDAAENSLYYSDQHGIPWAPIARELAYQIQPFGNVGALSPALKEALSLEDKQEVALLLTELGFEPVARKPEKIKQTAEIIQ